MTKLTLAAGTIIGLLSLDYPQTQAQTRPPCYFDASTPAQVRFKNETGRPIALYWQNYQCEENPIGNVVQPGWTLRLDAYQNIPLFVYDVDSGDLIQELTINPTTPSEIVLEASVNGNQSTAASPPPVAPVNQPPTSSNTDSNRSAQTLWIQRILATHNRYRSEVGVPPLAWSSELANDAKKWAERLASPGNRTLQHDPNTENGENLWMGTSGAFEPTEMVDSWGREKQYFVNDVFPNVSSTNQWSDVGHYTQIIWSNTTQVGCSLSSNQNFDFLVCRYNPPGNFQGQRVY
ncbi:MAG: CAP domain-containing protein [Leptolyngbyaceae cyanobacterium MO_188.B28]|nr:CAP domain-containing protein [Leptolyngbyaceae cyanobacterium MO_188.B28]